MNAQEREERRMLRCRREDSEYVLPEINRAHRACERECINLKVRVETLESAIKTFCRGHSWAVDSWKQQPHTKPIFDIFKTLEEK